MEKNATRRKFSFIQRPTTKAAAGKGIADVPGITAASGGPKRYIDLGP